MLVGVDDAGEGEPAGGVDGLGRVALGDAGGDQDDSAVTDGDVRSLRAGPVRTDNLGIADQKIVGGHSASLWFGAGRRGHGPGR